MNINKALDKAYESKTLKEILDAPVEVLEGLSEANGKALFDALGVKTVRDLATNKFVLWAQGIANLAAAEQ